MVRIHIDKEVFQYFPSIELGCLQADVLVENTSPELNLEIKKECELLQKQHSSVSSIAGIDTIMASREAYRKLGQDPSRYRLSAEALLRRVVQGKGVYTINNVVDLLNLVSMRSGFSIGGYDVSRIEGDVILGKGQEMEPYEAIGRGALNIARLPVLRDSQGAFGTPTSDSTRTMVQNGTRSFLMVFFNFNGSSALNETMDYTKDLLIKYASAKNLKKMLIKHVPQQGV